MQVDNQCGSILEPIADFQKELRNKLRYKGLWEYQIWKNIKKRKIAMHELKLKAIIAKIYGYTNGVEVYYEENNYDIFNQLTSRWIKIEDDS